MMNFLKNKKIELIILFFISLTPLLWLKDNEIILGHDSGFRPDGFSHLYNIFFSWTSIANFGFDWSLFKGFLITQAPEAFFTFVFRSLHNGEIATFIFWFFVMALSMYIFVWNLFPEKKYFILRLFASTFYVYNFFLLQGWFIAERAKFSLFAALPLGLLIIYKTLNKEMSVFRGSVLFGLIFFLLNGGGFPSLYGGVILVYLTVFVYFTVLNYLKNGYKEVVQSLITGISFLTSLIILNTYWLLPQFYIARATYSSGLGSQGGIEGILAWEAVISKSASFINLLRLQGIPDWYNNLSHPYANEYIANPILVIGSFIPIVIIIAGMLIKKNRIKENLKTSEKKIINLMFILFFVGLIFTAGSHPPTGKFYTLLIQYLPGFPIFRSGIYKFGPVLWFSVIFLSSYYLNLIINMYVKKKENILQLFVLSVTLLLVYHYPFFQGSFFNWNTPFTTKVTLPNYVSNAAKYISSNISNTSRILLLPELHPYYKSDGYNWGFWSVWPLPYTLSPKSFVSNDSAGDQKISTDLYDALNKKEFDLFYRLAGITGINNILWREDVVYINKPIQSSDLEEQKSILKEDINSKLTYGFGKWELYSLQNSDYVPLIYSPLQMEYVNSDSNVAKILKTLSIQEKRFATIYGDSKLLNYSSNEIIEADCDFCEGQSFKKVQDEVKIPDSQLLPDSLFVLANNLKETMLLSGIKKLDNAKKVDAYLTLSNNKFSQDVTLFKKGQNERTVKLHSQIVNSYNIAISNAILNANLLFGQSKNYYLTKISAYLEAQKRYLILSRGFYPNELFSPFYITITEKINDVESKLWISDETHKRFELNINNPGYYSLNISKEFTEPIKISIDEQTVINLTNVKLEKGYHRIEIEYPEAENLIEDFVAPKKMTLKFNDAATYGVKDFSSKDKYLINLKYKRIAGRFGEPFHILQWKDKIGADLISKTEFGLDTSDIPDVISYLLSPEPGVKALSLSFSQPYFTYDDSIVEIESLSVRKVINPNVFLVRNLKNETFPIPKIEFKRINPTKYIIHIENAQKPFFLIFGENFNPGWKIYYPKQFITKSLAGQSTSYFNGDVKDFTLKDYILDPFLTTGLTGSVNEENHFKANSYSNGWYIDKTGNLDLIIEYKPQRFVYLGIIISTAVLGIYLIYLFVRRKMNENN